MRAWKFLGAGAVGRFSDFAWPLPAAAAPAKWVEADQPLAECVSGVHACRITDLVEWIDDELWEIELDGEIEEHDIFVVGARGRLTRKVETWTPLLATELADACAWRASGFAVQRLRRDGHDHHAERLAAVTDLLDVRAYALAASEEVDGPASVAAAFAADAVALARGRRPEAPDLRVAVSDPTPDQTPGATAANLAFVAAHTAGLEAAVDSGDQASYASGFAAERAWQVSWLVERLDLPDSRRSADEPG